MTLYNLNPDSLDGSSANEAACKNSYRRAKSLCGPKLVRDNSMTPHPCSGLEYFHSRELLPNKAPTAKPCVRKPQRRFRLRALRIWVHLPVLVL